MTLPRREFLHVAAGAAAVATLAESAIPTGAQPQPPGKGELPKRSARDRLEEALARIADPKGEVLNGLLRHGPDNVRLSFKRQMRGGRLCDLSQKITCIARFRD
jgi:hypothetical protein